MYIKIATSSPLGQKIAEMWKRGAKYNSQALRWAKEQGADYIRGSWYCIFGGVLSAHFKNNPPKGWIKAGPKYDQGEYLIGKTTAGKELREAEAALPRITDDEFNELLNFDPDNRTSNKVCFHPGVQWGKDDYILVNIPDHTIYKPIEDMVEITSTEYKSLLKSKKNLGDN